MGRKRHVPNVAMTRTQSWLVAMFLCATVVAIYLWSYYGLVRSRVPPNGYELDYSCAGRFGQYLERLHFPLITLDSLRYLRVYYVGRVWPPGFRGPRVDLSTLLVSPQPRGPATRPSTLPVP